MTSERKASGTATGGETVVRHSFCRVCTNACPTLVQIEDGKVIKVTADRNGPIHQGYTCYRGRALADVMSNPKRQLHPTKLQPDGSRVPIGAEQAMDEITAKLQEIIAKYGPESVGMYAGTGVIKSLPLLSIAYSFMDGIGAPRRWSGNTLDQPGKQISHGLHGYWMAPPQAFDEPEVVLWIGINPLMTYSGLPIGSPLAYIKECERRGTKIITIDPRKHETARKSTLHIQPRPGEDVAIMAGLLRVILNEDLYDHEFVAENVDGLEDLRAAVQPFTPEVVAARADISTEDLLWTARTFAAANRGYVVAGTGPNMGTAQGTIFEYLVLALDTICGHYLRAGEVVRTPGTLSPAPVFTAQAHGPVPGWGFGQKLRFRGLTETLGGLPVTAMAEEILTPGDGQIRAMFVVNGNPASAVTDQLQVIEALESLELLVTTDVVLSVTARRAHYNLAPKIQVETPSMLGDFPPSAYANSYMGLRDAYAHYAPALIDPPPGSEVIEEWEMYYGIAQRMAIQLALSPAKIYSSSPPPRVAVQYTPPPLDMVNKPTTDDILKVIASAGRVPFEEVKRHPSGALFPPDPPVIVQAKEEGWTEKLDVGNDEMMADLADAFDTVDVTGELADGFEFRLLCRRMYQWNSALHIPAVDKGRPYNPAFMNPDDLARLGLTDGDLAEISSSRSAVPAVVMADAALRPGTVSMAHAFGDSPDRDDRVREVGSSTNRLIANDRVFDRHSGQPLMSNIPVNVRGISEDELAARTPDSPSPR
jgi:anaerobic selenocysteine-containing dehydrogenase